MLRLIIAYLKHLMFAVRELRTLNPLQRYYKFLIYARKIKDFWLNE